MADARLTSKTKDKKSEAIADRLTKLYEALPPYFAKYARPTIFGSQEKKKEKKEEKKEISSPSIQIVSCCIRGLEMIPSLLDGVLGNNAGVEKEAKKKVPELVEKLVEALNESQDTLKELQEGKTVQFSKEVLSNIEEQIASPSSSQPPTESMSLFKSSLNYINKQTRALMSLVPQAVTVVKTTVTESKPVKWGTRAVQAYSGGQTVLGEYTKIKTLWEESGFSLYSESDEALLEGFSLSSLLGNSSQTLMQRLIALGLRMMPASNERDTHLIHSFFGMHSPAPPVTPELPPIPAEPSPAEPKWNPTFHGSREWFPPLDFSKGAVLATKLISSALKDYKDRMEKKGQADIAELKLIEDTHKALQGKEGVQCLDREGYFIYLDEPEGTETKLSQSLKAIFNITWAINEALRGHWEAPGIRSNVNALYHLKKAYENYWKISWSGMGKEIGPFGKQIINMMLWSAEQYLSPKLRRLTNVLHEIEWSVHLRFGLLSEFIQPHLDFLENLFHQHGIGSFDNPFGYNAIEEKALQEKLDAAKKDEKEGTLKRQQEQVEAAIQTIQNLSKTKELPVAELVRTLCILDDQLPASHSVIGESASALLLLLTDDAWGNKFVLQLHQLKKPKKDREPIIIGEAKERQDNIQTDSLKEAFSKLLPIAKRRRTILEEQQCWDIPRYQEALKRLSEMRAASLCRRLKKSGLITLLEAAQNPGELNYIQEKRELAILLADFYKEDRIEWIQDAHAKVHAFAKDPGKIKAFVTEITQMDPAIGYILEMELYFAGYIDVIADEKKGIEKKSDSRQTMCYLLDRLLFKHIHNMISPSAMDAKDQKHSSEAISPNIKRGHDFLRLIQQDKSGGSESSSPTALQSRNLSPELLINALITRYRQEEKKGDASSSKSKAEEASPTGNEIRNKIGLFLGRIADADQAIAKIIFDNTAAKEIVKKECLTPPKQDGVRSDKALYYGALVHTLPFNYQNEAHEEENRYLNDFLDANESIVCAIHANALDQQEQKEREGIEEKKSLPSSKKETEEKKPPLTSKEILAIYKENPAKLFEDTERFIRTGLPPNSVTKKKMCQFFSALLLCNDKKIKKIHLKILDWYVDYQGLSCTKYLEFLTPEASHRFWKSIKTILTGDNYQEEYYLALDKQQTELNQYLSEKGINVASQIMRDQFKATLTEFIQSKKNLLNGRRALLRREQGNKIPLNCRSFREAVQAAEKEVEAHCTRLRNEINDRIKKQEAIKQTREALQENIAILESYKASRNATSAWFLSCLYWPLRYQKIQLVDQYLTKFKSYLSQLDTITEKGINIESLQGLLMDDMEQLNKKHDTLAKTPEEKGILSGKLSYIASRTTAVRSKDLPKDEKKYQEATKEHTFYTRYL